MEVLYGMVRGGWKCLHIVEQGPPKILSQQSQHKLYLVFQLQDRVLCPRMGGMGILLGVAWLRKVG